MLNILKLALPSNLHSGDKNSMAHGIEVRFPFLDYKLVDFTFNLPENCFINDGWSKYLLRKISEDYVPQEIAWRPDKVGFVAPGDKWLASPKMVKWISERIYDNSLDQFEGFNRDIVESMLSLHTNNVKDYSNELWKWASTAELSEIKNLGYWKIQKNVNKVNITTKKETTEIKILKYLIKIFNL